MELESAPTRETSLYWFPLSQWNKRHSPRAKRTQPDTAQHSKAEHITAQWGKMRVRKHVRVDVVQELSTVELRGCLRQFVQSSWNAPAALLVKFVSLDAVQLSEGKWMTLYTVRGTLSVWWLQLVQDGYRIWCIQSKLFRVLATRICNHTCGYWWVPDETLPTFIHREASRKKLEETLTISTNHTKEMLILGAQFRWKLETRRYCLNIVFSFFYLSLFFTIR